MNRSLIPGHNTPEELLAYMVAPATRVGTDNRTLPANEIIQVIPLENRTEIIIQTQTAGVVWVQLNDDTPALNRGFRLEGAFGLRLSADVKVTLVAEADTNVLIMQMGV